MVISKLPTPQFKPSYTLNVLPTLNGSLGYLYTSRPLEIGTSATVDFQDMIDRFRIIVKQPSTNAKDYQGIGGKELLTKFHNFSSNTSSQSLQTIYSMAACSFRGLG